MRTFCALIALLLLLPAGARAAATAKLDPSGNPQFNGDTGTQVTDKLVITGDPNGITFSDSVAITPTAPCTAVNANTVKCVGQYPFASVSAYGGGAADTVDASAVANMTATLSSWSGAIGTASNDTLSAVPSGGNLQGGSGDDSINGSDGNDTLDGGPGKDTLRPGKGADTVRGGDGDDQVYTGPDGDASADGGAGSDRLDFAASTQGVTVDLANPAAGSYQATGFEVVSGSPFNDVLRGTDASETFFGNGGDDTLEPRGGQDYAYGGPGNDTLLMRDGVADYAYTCDDASNQGTNDSAQLDGIDTGVAQGCDTIDKPATPPSTCCGLPSGPGLTPGDNGSAGAHLVLMWATGTVAHPKPPKHPSTTKVVAYNAAAVLLGRVTNASGAPITNARLATYLGGSHYVTTDANGSFSYTVGAGPSREIEFQYYFPGAPTVRVKARLNVRGHTSLKLSRTRIVNNTKLTFSGTLPKTSAKGKEIQLQARVGRSWFTFASATARSGGSWKTTARFRGAAGHSQYLIRARVPAESGYPYLTAVSATKKLEVRR